MPVYSYPADGGSLYLANCTSDPSLCTSHNVTGFPTLIAFRGLGWLETSECMPQGVSIGHSNKYVRMDYHGVITVRNSEIINYRPPMHYPNAITTA